MKYLPLFATLILSASPVLAQAPGCELDKEYKSDNWVVVLEHQIPIQKNQYEMALIDKPSLKNTSGSRWDFDIAFLQWDTYANPNYYALTRNDSGGVNWVDCTEGMYVLEWDTPGNETYLEDYYSRSGAWLDKTEFESRQFQFPEQDDDWNDGNRLPDNRWT